MNAIIDSLSDLHSVQSPDRLPEINAAITMFNHWFLTVMDFEKGMVDKQYQENMTKQRRKMLISDYNGLVFISGFTVLTEVCGSGVRRTSLAELRDARLHILRTPIKGKERALINPTTTITSPATATTEIPSKSAIIESDRKRKEPVDRAAAGDHRSKHKHNHHHHHDKKSKMSSSSSSDKVRASHILIKHEGSRRKASWKDPEGRIISNTTRDAAVSQLKTLRDDIVSGKSKFEDVASRYSDCSSAKRGGDLGSFGRKQMQKPFEEATYALKLSGKKGATLLRLEATRDYYNLDLMR
ncbi:unnamed protein product [Lactuca saligna]|uniref:Peptidyl-prolyl cis-trans isomerase Pin1 n=1 Tax=Lactuca saligna TaxID=75948 RepID=A0AA35W1G9_LACSI|nr:unnamed protein product [Lactuca saligna]